MKTIRKTGLGTLQAEVPTDKGKLTRAITALEFQIAQDKKKGDAESQLIHEGALREFREAFMGMGHESAV